MIVEERTYHVYTGKLGEAVALYASEGTELQQRVLGHLIGAFTVDIGDLSSLVQLWGYDSMDERDRRRAAASGRAGVEGVPGQAHAADPHAAQPHPAADVVLAAAMSRLDGKVAIVTGGAQGIGRAIADGLAAEGARIVIADLRGAEEAAADLPRRRRADGRRRRRGRPSRGWPTTSSSAAAASTSSINNAGLYATLAMRPFDQIDVAEWRRVMDVNVLSMFLTCRAVVPRMRERGGGRIVNISSGTPFRGVPFLLHYVTSKGAIVALTRALAKELGGDDVLVNCVAPGFTMSEGVLDHPEVVEQLRDVSVSSRTLRRDQEPGDVVGAVVFLCTPEASFVTGQTMVIDGGQYFH